MKGIARSLKLAAFAAPSAHPAATEARRRMSDEEDFDLSLKST